MCKTILTKLLNLSMRIIELIDKSHTVTVYVSLLIRLSLLSLSQGLYVFLGLFLVCLTAAG